MKKYTLQETIDWLKNVEGCGDFKCSKIILKHLKESQHKDERINELERNLKIGIDYNEEYDHRIKHLDEVNKSLSSELNCAINENNDLKATNEELCGLLNKPPKTNEQYRPAIEGVIRDIEKWEGEAYQPPNEITSYQGDEIYQAVRQLKLLIGDVLTYRYRVERSPIVHPCLSGEVEAIDGDEAYYLAKGKISNAIDGLNRNLMECGMSERYKLKLNIEDDNLTIYQKFNEDDDERMYML